MSEKILFGVIGTTDPIKNQFDGPFLHIMRYYRPEIAYLFFTKEIYKYHIKDDRYVDLGNRVYPKCKITIMEKYKDFDNPQDFQKSYEEMKSAVEEIMGKHKDSEIIFNVSSGTPQMISALTLIATFSKRKIKCVQVLSPEKKSNQSKDEKFEKEEVWKNNLDNIADDSIENRCLEITPDSIKYEMVCALIKENTASYNYEAALKVAERNKEFLNERILSLLEIAKDRKNLFFERAQKKAEKIGYEIYSRNIKPEARDIFEFYLVLEIKHKREECPDFSRSISPLLKELSRQYLMREHKTDITKYCDYIKKKKTHKLKRNKMGKELGKYYDNYYNSDNDERGFTDAYLAFSNIVPMIKYKSISSDKYDELIKKIDSLKEFEGSVRNTMAHQMIELDDKKMKTDFRYSSEDIIGLVKYFLIKTFPELKDVFPWNSYDKNNEEIEKLM